MDDEGEPLRLTLVQKARAVLAALRPAYWQSLAVVVLLYQARFDVSFIMIHAATVRVLGACCTPQAECWLLGGLRR